MDTPSIASDFFSWKCSSVCGRREHSVPSPPAHCPPPQSEAEQASSHSHPSLAEVRPGTLSLHPPSLWSLSQAFPPSPCKLFTASEVGTLSSKAVWLVRVQDPSGLPKLLLILCSHLGPGLGRRFLTLSRPIPVGRAGLEGRREVTHIHTVGAQADCVGSDRSGKLTVPLGPLRVALGVSRAHPEREDLCPVFLCHMPPPVCLCLSLLMEALSTGWPWPLF